MITLGNNFITELCIVRKALGKQFKKEKHMPKNKNRSRNIHGEQDNSRLRKLELEN